MSPSDLLHAARSMLEKTGGMAPALWPRSAAILGRQALEGAVRQMWRRRPDVAEMAERSMRSQLISLPVVVSPDTSSRIRFVWGALTEACHYHPYELAPTAGELSRWLDEVGRLLEADEVQDRVDTSA